MLYASWSVESWPRLHADKDLWLNGSSQVSVVVLLKWSKLSNSRARGTAEVWRRGTGGGLTVDIKVAMVR